MWMGLKRVQNRIQLVNKKNAPSDLLLALMTFCRAPDELFYRYIHHCICFTVNLQLLKIELSENSDFAAPLCGPNKPRP